MARVTWRGVTLDDRTRDMMEEVARNTGDIYVNPTQGSWSHAAASAGTHSGAGAIDLMHPSWSVKDYDTVVREMRRVGFAAWHRTPQQANWPRHVHGIAIGAKGLADGAVAQVAAYKAGRNGLASGGPDDGPRQFVGVTWETYQEAEDDVKQEDIDAIIEGVAKAVNATLGGKDLSGKERTGQWLLQSAQRMSARAVKQDGDAYTKDTD